MSTQHTPGPWLADLEIYPVMVRSQSETWPLVDEIGNEEGRAGAFVCNTGDNKANARLIAAAPDLLEELKQMVRAYVRLMENGRDRIRYLGGDCDPVDKMEADDPNLRAAKAAIAKATEGGK